MSAITYELAERELRDALKLEAEQQVELYPNGVYDMVKSAAIGVVSLLLTSALAFAYVNPDGSITPSITDSYLWINFAILGLPAIWIPIVYG